MDSSTSNSPLADILKHTVIPWVEQAGMKRVHTVRCDWQPLMDLPEGMAATHKPLQGKRVPTRGGRAYGASVTEASWPDDNMTSARTPKLCFVLTGPIVFQVNDYVLHCQPGHGILIPSGIPFASGRQSYLDQSRQHQGICEILQIMPYHGGLICWLSRRQHDAVNKPHVHESTCSIPHSRAPFYLHQLVDEAMKGQLHQSLVCDSLLKITLALLHRELLELPVLETGKIQDPQPIPHTGNESYSIRQAQEYIEINLRESLSIDRVARYVCMSRTIFTAQFRAKTGKTFSSYTQDLRFKEARALLKGSDLSVRHISAAVGLRPNRLRVLFHEREGISPLEFRGQSRKTEK